NVLQHSTLIGGSGNDVVYDMEIDQYGNVYLMGNTTSSSMDTPPGGNNIGTYGFNPKGSNDYFVFAISPTSTASIWAAIYGGSGADGVYTAGGYSWQFKRTVNGAIDGNNNLFIVGPSTSQSNFELDDGGGVPWYNGSAGNTSSDG